MMVYHENLVHAFVKLGERILSRPPELEAVVHRSSLHNPWFTKDNIWLALENIAVQYLDPIAIRKWIEQYEIPVPGPRIIGIVMAGNLPLVGFHDFLSVLISGHRVQVKLSEKDPYLFPWIVSQMNELIPQISHAISVVPTLKQFDAVIATGSDNSARYFKQYFDSYPHVIRKNRNAVAVLDGNETTDQLKGLALDIFSFFGLGCRSVSKIFIPTNYRFEGLISALDHFNDLANHHKYKNNIDYNTAVQILNKVPNISLSHLILIEKGKIASRIGCLHYSYYDDLEQLTHTLLDQKEKIQCIVSDGISRINGIPVVGFGQSQKPSLTDYADGVDTMQFLSNL